MWHVFHRPGNLGVEGRSPPLNPDDLKDMSTHIVVGKLRMVYRSVEMHGDFQYTHGIAEIAVEKVEKGVGPKGGEVVYVRFWNDIWIGKGPVPPHSDGHHVPMQGANVPRTLSAIMKVATKPCCPTDWRSWPSPRRGHGD